MSRLAELEAGLRKQLQGKTMLGEVAFEERHCDQSAQGFKKVFSQYGRWLCWVSS